MFRGRYFWASNFSSSPLYYKIGDDEKETLFPTAEHLYQALKYVDRPSIMKMIAELKTPVEAKKIGNEIKAIPEHLKDSYRIWIMQNVIDLKYELPLYKAYLLSTKDEYITHDVLHNDQFFGRNNGVGQNHLGMMLMDKRDDLMYLASERALLSSYDMELNARLILDPRKATLRIAGIGSRDLPEEVGKQIDELMEDLNDYTNGKLIVHTGDADGADLRFKKNAVNCISYIPSKGFNGSTSNLYNVSREAKILASFHHPYFDKMKPVTQNLMGRNVYQVMSNTFDNWVDCVICYTSDGAEKASDVKVGVTGGTGLAISLADTLGIPVFNLKNEDAVSRIMTFYSLYKNKALNKETKDIIEDLENYDIYDTGEI